MKKYTLLSCALAVLLSGCGAHKPAKPLSLDQEAEFAKHVISVDRDGRLKIIQNGEVKKVVSCVANSEECETYFNDIIKGIGEQLAKNKKDIEVLFFVHGGLNKETEAIERARQQLALIHKDDKYNNIYPIFVLWESDGLETYTDHLLNIRQGEDEAPESWLSSPIYLLTDVGNSIVNTPKSWLGNGKHMWDSITVPIEEKEDKLAKELCEVNKELPKENHVSYAKIKDYEPEPNPFRRMRWVLGSPSKAVVTPFAYTMARPAWDIMLRRTNTLFYTPEDLRKNSLSEEPVHISQRSPGNAALYDFLNRFDCSIEPRTGKECPYPSNTTLSDIKITLIGHSMGAIVVNKIVLLKPELPYKNIVHMASADSINNLFNTVIPYINYSIEKKKDECSMPKDSPECTEWAKGQAVQFYSLMLHPDNEDREEAWGGLVPSGSLLTWIDNMYTSPETVLDKRSGRWDNIKSSIKFLPTKVKENMHFKIFDIDLSKENKKKCDENILVVLGLVKEEYRECPKPQKHGAFDALAFWDEATWK